MSEVVHEDEKTIILSEQIGRYSNQEYSDWELNEDGTEKNPDISRADHYALYEMTVIYEIDKRTLQDSILSVRYKGRTLT